MILGVISDTHGNRMLMHQVATRLVREHGAEQILHLGDDYEDAEELAATCYDVCAVPGLWCEAYHNPRVPKTRVERFAGVDVALAHADKDLGRKERAADIVLTGHTHRAAIEEKNGAIYVCPGHLRRAVDRGERASYAVLHLDAEAVRVVIHEAGGVREEHRCTLTR